MVQGQVFLKWGEGVALFLFNFFKVYQITLLFAKLRYAFEGKIFFFSHYNFMKKIIPSCLKMSLKISDKLR